MPQGAGIARVGSLLEQPLLEQPLLEQWMDLLDGGLPGHTINRVAELLPFRRADRLPY